MIRNKSFRLLFFVFSAILSFQTLAQMPPPAFFDNPPVTHTKVEIKGQEANGGTDEQGTPIVVCDPNPNKICLIMWILDVSLGVTNPDDSLTIVAPNGMEMDHNNVYVQHFDPVTQIASNHYYSRITAALVENKFEYKFYQ
jgi:hypothetical protein